jgi:uncharacterized DUF497 family protein
MDQLPRNPPTSKSFPLSLAYTLHIQCEGAVRVGREQPTKDSGHRITREEAEQALLNNPIAIYEQDVQGEIRYVYYGETNAGRLLAVVVTERHDSLRVVTAYNLDAGQKREYLRRRMEGQ